MWNFGLNGFLCPTHIGFDHKGLKTHTKNHALHHLMFQLATHWHTTRVLPRLFGNTFFIVMIYCDNLHCHKKPFNSIFERNYWQTPYLYKTSCKTSVASMWVKVNEDVSQEQDRGVRSLKR